MKELKLKAKESGLLFQKDGDFTKIYSSFKNEKLYKSKEGNKVNFDGDSVSSDLLGCEIGKVSNPFNKVSFNGLFLKDIIKQHGEEVSVSVPALNSSGFINKSCRFGDDNYFTIIMPYQM